MKFDRRGVHICLRGRLACLCWLERPFSFTERLAKTCLREGDCFIDLGANIGLASLRAAKIVKGHGRIIALEADERTADLLRENIGLNAFRNIWVPSYAAAADDGPAFLSGSDTETVLAAKGRKTAADTIDNIVLVETDHISLLLADVNTDPFAVLSGARAALAKTDAVAAVVRHGKFSDRTAEFLGELGFTVSPVQSEKDGLTDEDISVLYAARDPLAFAVRLGSNPFQS